MPSSVASSRVPLSVRQPGLRGGEPGASSSADGRTFLCYGGALDRSAASVDRVVTSNSPPGSDALIGNAQLAKPIVAIAAAPDGKGYWLATSNGGIFKFGPGAKFYGSIGNAHLTKPIVGIAAAPEGKGYSLGGPGRRCTQAIGSPRSLARHDCRSRHRRRHPSRISPKAGTSSGPRRDACLGLSIAPAGSRQTIAYAREKRPSGASERG